MCIKQGFICWGGLAEEARRERALALRGGLQSGIEQLAKQDLMGITYRLSKLLDELSLQYCKVSLQYCSLFICRGTHTQRDGKRGRGTEREREWGKCHLFEILVFGHFLIEHIFFYPEKLKGSHCIHLFTHKLLPVPSENPVTSEQTHRSILP